MIDLAVLEKVMLDKCIEHYEDMICPQESFDEFLDNIGYEGDRTKIKKMYEEMDKSVPPLQLLYIEIISKASSKTTAKCIDHRLYLFILKDLRYWNLFNI